MGQLKHIVYFFSLILLIILTNCNVNNTKSVNTIEVNDFPFTDSISSLQHSRDDIFNYAYVDLKLFEEYVLVVDWIFQ